MNTLVRKKHTHCEEYYMIRKMRRTITKFVGRKISVYKNISTEKEKIVMKQTRQEMCLVILVGGQSL
jgi:hypothetical protein